MVNRVALDAFLGHLEVIRRTHQLDLATTRALLNEALAHFDGASPTAIVPDEPVVTPPPPTATAPIGPPVPAAEPAAVTPISSEFTRPVASVTAPAPVGPPAAPLPTQVTARPIVIDDSGDFDLASVLDESDLLDDLLPTAPTPAQVPELVEEANAGASLRAQPRFVARAEVDVTLAGRGALQTLWMKDISKGGLFVTTDDPPPSGTIVSVALKTPDGQLNLQAEVVHVLDVEAAKAVGMAAGVGLQFVDLDAERREALERYIEGLATKLEDGSTSGPVLAATADLVQDARDFLREVDAANLYGALKVEPQASHGELSTVLADFESRFDTSGAPNMNETDQGRVERAGRVLDRVKKVLLETHRRLDYDFRQEIVRADTRIADAAATGANVAEIRAIWERIWPARVKEAADYTAASVDAIKNEGDFAKAVITGRQACELDPFNLELVNAVESWAFIVDLPGQFASDPFDPEAVLSEAVRLSVDPVVVRGVWNRIFPEKVVEASTHARRAMAAEGAKAFDQAVEQGEAALALDPLNIELRNALNRWRDALIAMETADEASPEA